MLKEFIKVCKLSADKTQDVAVLYGRDSHMAECRVNRGLAISEDCSYETERS